MRSEDESVSDEKVNAKELAENRSEDTNELQEKENRSEDESLSDEKVNTNE